MFQHLRKLLGRDAASAPAGEREPQLVDRLSPPFLAPVLLERFLQPRALERAVRGWPDELATPAVRLLVSQGHIAEASPAESFAVLCTVPKLQGLLRTHSLHVSGNKDTLVRRLLDAGVAPPASRPVYACTSAGRKLALARQVEREAALQAAASEALALLQAHRVADASRVVRQVRERWPAFDDVAAHFNPLAINVDTASDGVVEAALVATPGILGSVSPEDLQRLRLAVAIWHLGLPQPGMDMALAGYTGSGRFEARRACHLLLFFAINSARVRRAAGLGCRKAVVSFVTPCPSCAALDGKTYRIGALPELPNPGCQGNGCTFLVRPEIPGMA